MTPPETRYARSGAIRIAYQLIGKAAFYGVSEGGPMALLFTATYPDRTQALVLYGSYACHPSTLSAENIDQHIATIDRAWGTGEYTAQGFCARTAADETFWRSLAR